MAIIPEHNNIHAIFQEWVNKYTDALYSWALYKTSDRQLSEDLVQETFMAAYNAYDNFKNDSQPKTWLMAILNNKIADHYRKNKTNPLMNQSDMVGDASAIFDRTFDNNGEWEDAFRPQAWAGDEHLLDNLEFNSTLQHCMDQLPKDWNVAIQMKYLKGENGHTISQELGVSTSNYWQIIHRAKLFLRECLEMLWFKK